MLQQEIKDLFPPIMKDALDTLVETTGATDEITVPTILAVATFATQGLADAEPLAWDSCAISNYYCVLVPSGGLKTSIMDLVLSGARKFEEDQLTVSEDSKNQYELDMKVYEDERKKWIKQRNGITIPGITQPTFNHPKPKPPRGDRYITGKGTLNGIIDALKEVPHFGIFNSDAAEFFNSHSHSDKNRSIEMVSALSRLWSGEQIDKLTGMESVVTKGKRTTALFMLQPDLADFLVKPEFINQGFVPRILITQSERIAKKPANFTSPDFSTKLTAVARLKPFNDRIYELLEAVDKNQKNPATISKNIFAIRAALLANTDRDINRLVLFPHPVCKHDNSFQILQDFYNDMLEKQTQSEYSKFESFISRAYEHCIRLATVLSLFDRRSEVNERDAACAAGLMYYFIQQRMNLEVDGSVEAHPIIVCSRAVEEFLIRKHEGMFIDKTLLNNYGPKIYRNMKPDDRRLVIKDLVERKILIEVDKKLQVAGSV